MEIDRLFEDISLSYTPFHAVERAKLSLLKAGFTELREGDTFKLSKGGKYFVTKNDTALIAFVVGENPIYNIVAAHTDSPSLKIKANASKTVADFTKLNVEKYGGAILSSWFDRKLGIAGRLAVKTNGGIKSVLVEGGITVVIPSLAIHYNRDVNDGVAINVQEDMCPVVGKDVTMEQLFKEQAGGEIIDYDLYLYAKGKPYFYGAHNELVASPRLDDLEGAFGGLYALINSQPKNTAVLALFDNEEVGSRTKQGAAGTFLADTIRRIALAQGHTEEQRIISLANSMMVSMDNAHGKHPNHDRLSDPTNPVSLNDGIVIKHHGNQNYTSDAISSAIFKSILDKANVKHQDFYMRSDLKCGGTLGALSSSQLSIRSVDIGLAQWAMHSAVESAGAEDFDSLVVGLTAFFNAEKVSPID